MGTYVATLPGGWAQLSERTVAELAARLEGAALTPSGGGWAEVPQPFNVMYPSRPSLVIRCASTADVVEAVTFARTAGTGSFAGRGSLVTSVHGGGHSIDGLASVHGGVLVDLSPMRAVEVDPAARLARVQGGALWGDVDRHTQAAGLAAPGGMVSGTGVGGLTLGGGHGWIRRMHGLACDQLVAAEVVCADGQVRIASADSNADLFWGLRGGGGNFGVVTSFTFRLVPLGPTVAFARTYYPLEELAEVLRGWRAYVSEAPPEVSSMCTAVTLPAAAEVPDGLHGRAVAMVAAVHCGDSGEGMSRLQPLRELGTALADLSRPTPFTAVQSAFDARFPRGERYAYWRSRHLHELRDETIDLVAARARERPTPLTMVSVLHMGGAIAAVGAEETACGERSAPFAVSVAGTWTEPADNADRIAWVRRVSAELAGEGPGTSGDGSRERRLDRLAAVKAIYDPDNFFRLNRNIAPAR